MKDVARLAIACGARRTRGSCDSEYVEAEQYRLTLDAGNGHIEIIGKTEFRIGRPIERGLGDRREETGGEMIPQSHTVVCVGIAPPVGTLQGQSKPHDPRHILRSTAAPLLLATTDLLKFEGRPTACIEQADPFWSVELVSRKRKQVDGESIDVQWQCARRL